MNRTHLAALLLATLTLTVACSSGSAGSPARRSARTALRGVGGVAFDRKILKEHTAIKRTPQLDAAMRRDATWVGSHCQGPTS